MSSVINKFYQTPVAYSLIVAKRNKAHSHEEILNIILKYQGSHQLHQLWRKHAKYCSNPKHHIFGSNNYLTVKKGSLTQKSKYYRIRRKSAWRPRRYFKTTANIRQKRPYKDKSQLNQIDYILSWPRTQTSSCAALIILFLLLPSHEFVSELLHPSDVVVKILEFFHVNAK